MAIVYLAEDLKHDRKVALKVLRPELAAMLGGDRFVAEIKTTAGLQHPHILPLFDSGQAMAGQRSFLYYVMPYIEGETFRVAFSSIQRIGPSRHIFLEFGMQKPRHSGSIRSRWRPILGVPVRSSTGFRA